MRKVIQEVLGAELKAKEIVQAARAEAERIASEARKQSEELAARKREQAQHEAATIVETALKAAEQEKRHQLDQRAARIQAELRIDEAVREAAVAGIIQCICGQNRTGDEP